MLLSEIFSYITTLDSANINIGNDDGVLSGKYYTKTINAVNLALIELYTQFPIKKRIMTIQLYSHITEYFLDSKYAATNTESSELYKYITDTSSNPFYNDVIHVDVIYNEVGEKLYLNKEDEPLSLYTPAFNIIQHPYPTNSNAIFVSYSALPRTIEQTVDPDTYEVELPRQVLNLFLLFVDHKLLASVNKEASTKKLNEYIAMLAKAQTTALFLADETANTKIEALGWE